MYHIYFTCAKADRMAGAMLLRKLKWHHFFHKYANPIVIHSDMRELSMHTTDQNFLIVICSLYSAYDPQVEADILRFHEHAPLSHIIPYVISGHPNAKDPRNECLPSILRALSHNDLLAANALELGKRTAFHRIISTVHEISLDELEKRSKKQRTRRRIITLLLIIMFAGYAFYSEYTTTTHTEYYQSYRYAYGVPIGIGRLSTIERLFYQDYYIFRVNYKNTLRIEKVGNPPTVEENDPLLQQYYDAIDTPVVVFSYHTDGTLDAAVHSDENDNILFVINYLAQGAAADFSVLADGIEPYFLELEGAEEACSRFIYEYDSEGILIGIRYAVSSAIISTTTQ